MMWQYILELFVLSLVTNENCMIMRYLNLLVVIVWFKWVLDLETHVKNIFIIIYQKNLIKNEKKQ